jgi:hypothetical protein
MTTQDSSPRARLRPKSGGGATATLRKLLRATNPSASRGGGSTGAPPRFRFISRAPPDLKDSIDVLTRRVRRAPRPAVGRRSLVALRKQGRACLRLLGLASARDCLSAVDDARLPDRLAAWGTQRELGCPPARARRGARHPHVHASLRCQSSPAGTALLDLTAPMRPVGWRDSADQRHGAELLREVPRPRQRQSRNTATCSVLSAHRTVKA